MASEQGSSRGEGRGNGGSIPPPEHRFKPGQSGNPKGRPPGYSVTARLRKILEADNGAGAEAVAEALVAWCKQTGDSAGIRAIRTVLERVDGAVPQAHQLTGADGGPIEIEIVLSENGNGSSP